MGYVEWNCPKCGKKNREACNAWVYGNPIRMLIVDKEAAHKQHTRIASPVLFRIELISKADKIHVSCPPYQFNR